ncbi:MAG TPA: hypothetical protein DCX79_13465 [Planctomycetaceae bacterium]|nr:hypothetical protein [Planctomycetaceae bacterium]
MRSGRTRLFELQVPGSSGPAAAGILKRSMAAGSMLCRCAGGQNRSLTVAAPDFAMSAMVLAVFSARLD